MLRFRLYCRLWIFDHWYQFGRRSRPNHHPSLGGSAGIPGQTTSFYLENQRPRKEGCRTLRDLFSWYNKRFRFSWGQAVQPPMDHLAGCHPRMKCIPWRRDLEDRAPQDRITGCWPEGFRPDSVQQFPLADGVVKSSFCETSAVGSDGKGRSKQLERSQTVAIQVV